MRSHSVRLGSGRLSPGSPSSPHTVLKLESSMVSHFTVDGRQWSLGGTAVAQTFRRMTEASELVGGDSGKPQRHSHRLLDLCVVAGLQPARLDMLLKDLQQNGDDAATVSPEVLSVHAPPFIGPQSARTGPEESGAPPGNCHGSAHPPSEAMATRKGVDLCGIPELCFPDGFHLDTEGKPDSFHFLVLTDIHGNREQGVVLRVYRELQDPQDTEPVDVSPRPRAPVAICLISKFPYYSALKDCLSCVLPELRACGQQEFDRKVRELAAQLTLVPCPPPGSLQLCFELGPIIVVLPPPGDVDTPPIDISLHLPLLCFSPSTVLQIVTCLLTERRLVFVSRDWPLLTLMTECFVYYLRPLPWRHPYIPVLASSMLDMLMAPTVFLMGCHSRHIRTVIELEELVLVDIDTGTVVFPQTPEHQAPPLPTAITEEFITSVQRLRLHPELASASLPICTGLAAARQRDLHRRQQINSHVQRIFLQLIGSLLRDVSKYLNLKHRVFIKKDFLDSREPASQPFYISHLRTDLFHCFLKARLNDRVDAFSRWEMATRPQTPRLNAEPSPTGHSSPFTSDAARTSNDHMSQEPSLAASLASHHPGDPGNTGVRVRPTIVPRCLYLPPLPSAPLDDLSVSLFYTKLVVDITRELEGVGGDDGGVRAVCLYLRGVVRLCQGQPVPALLDFQSLEKIDMDFFPLELVRQTLESMSTEQLRALQETEGLKGLLHGVLEKHWDRARPEHSVRDLELPVWPLDRQQFTALAQAAGLVSTAITADCLFDILAAGQDHVSPRMFTRMYGQWRGCGEEGAVGCPSEVLACLREGEILSLVSLPVKTNQGTGRLLLTNHRLCLLTDSTAPCREIAQLRDVEEVEAAVPVSGLPLRGGSLKVGVRGQKHAFVATLRGERDLWKLALRELCAGKLLAHRHKDPHYNQQARSNVRLLQAVALCPPPARTAHLMCRLAQLDQAASQPLPEVPQMTSDALRHTLHLSDAASISLTVTALLYVPGSLDPGERADSPPTLWCTLADGRLLVYNAATWEMERPPLRAGTARLNCVLLVYGGGLWLGSEDSYIYVVSGEDQSCHRRLTAHRNQVTGLVQGTLGQASPVFSCSMDGTVVVWDPVTMESCSQLQLQQCCHLSAISLHQRNLWCCADHSLVLLAWDGQQLQKVIHGLSPDGGSVPWSHFLILPQREEVWVLSTPSCSLYVWSMRCLSAPAWVVSMPSAGHCMVHVKEQVWVGGAAPDGGGRIQVVSAADRSLVKELEASGGPVTALCCAHDRYMLSASATGQASIWSVD